MDIKIVSTTDFIRNFGTYANLLPQVNELVLIRDGRRFATIKATPEEKNRELLSFLGSWDPKLFGNEKVWKAVMIRRDRKTPIKL